MPLSAMRFLIMAVSSALLVMSLVPGVVIPKITPHWLRHTFATILYFAGVDILTAKEQLGHSDIKTTLGIYTHLDKQYKRKSMSRLDEYLDDASRMQVSNFQFIGLVAALPTIVSAA